MHEKNWRLRACWNGDPAQNLRSMNLRVLVGWNFCFRCIGCAVCFSFSWFRCLWGYVYLIISDPSASFALCDIRIICGNAFAENLGDTTNSSWIGGRRTNSLLLVLCCVMLCVHYKSVAQSVLVWFGHWLVGWLPSLWVQSTLPSLKSFGQFLWTPWTDLMFKSNQKFIDNSIVPMISKIAHSSAWEPVTWPAQHTQYGGLHPYHVLGPHTRPLRHFLGPPKGPFWPW